MILNTLVIKEIGNDEMAYKIILDAGHGGSDPGAVYQGRQEKDDVLKLTLAVGDILQENGYEIEYTRTTDIYETPYEKAVQGNTSGADLFVSIHRNAFPTPNTASGVETLIYDNSGIKYEIAESINAELEKIGFRNLGIKERPNLIVLKRTEMPSVLVEVGFIDNEKDNALFDAEFDNIAKGIAAGIMNVIEQENQAPGYQVQIGLYRNRLYAEEVLNELLKEGYPAYIINDDSGFLAVKVGNYEGFSEAIAMEQKLKQDGYQTIIVTA